MLTTCGRFAKYAPGPNQLMLTKGDNNHVDDVELYQGLDFLERRHIIGKVRGFVGFFVHGVVLFVFAASFLI